MKSALLLTACLLGCAVYISAKPSGDRKPSGNWKGDFTGKPAHDFTGQREHFTGQREQYTGERDTFTVPANRDGGDRGHHGGRSAREVGEGSSGGEKRPDENGERPTGVPPVPQKDGERPTGNPPAGNPPAGKLPAGGRPGGQPQGQQGGGRPPFGGNKDTTGKPEDHYTGERFTGQREHVTGFPRGDFTGDFKDFTGVPQNFPGGQGGRRPFGGNKDTTGKPEDHYTGERYTGEREHITGVPRDGPGGKPNGAPEGEFTLPAGFTFPPGQQGGFAGGNHGGASPRG